MPEELPEYKVVRTARRRRTVSARMVGDTLELRVPGWMRDDEAHAWAGRMWKRLRNSQRRARPADADLEERARLLNRRFFGGRLQWHSISWAAQERRWGSCTPDAGVIRISEHLRGAPRWVVDYVIVHELAHLEQPGHGTAFWRLVKQYPLTERARGFLRGLEHAGSGIRGEG